MRKDMGKILKKENGITLTALAIAISILVIITTMLVYNAKDSVYIKNLTNMYNDISDLRDKISNYYVIYGDVPVLNIQYTNSENLNKLKNAGVIGANDKENDYYVIDLNALDNVTLNYGQDFSSIKETISNNSIDEEAKQELINAKEDVYIINKNSHNIFYVAGIAVKQDDGTQYYYTDYSDDEIDQLAVNLNYVDGIKVPDGYICVEGNRKEDIIIKEKDTGKQYKWIVISNQMKEMPTDITLKSGQTDKDFIESANAYYGYFKNIEDGNNEAFSIVLEDVWSPEFKQMGKYIDRYDNKVYVPAGFQVSRNPTMDNVKDGLVIKDSSGNEYVWIPCTLEEYQDATSDRDSWISYEYKDVGKTWTDEQTAIGEESIEKYRGFYVARYEAGIPEEATDIYASKNGDLYNINRNITNYTPVSKKGMQAWNLISQSNAKTLAEKMVSDNYSAQSYLIDSHAWDTICRKIDSKYGNDKNIKDSTKWGNYYNNETTAYEELNTLYAIHTFNESNSSWTYATNYKKGVVEGAPKNSGSNRLELSTGVSTDFKTYNIYDFAGNMWEWTTEIGKVKGLNTIFSAIRGGGYSFLGNTDSVVACYGTDSERNSSIYRFPSYTIFKII